MIIERLLLNNLGPFLAEWEVELPLGVTAVVGEYDGSPLSSNRAGKSYLAADAPLYALHGRFRGGADDLVHRLAAGVEDGFVELAVRNSEGTPFCIRRGRTRGGDPIRTLDGAAIKEADLERVVLEEILGLSYEEHVLTTAFVQGRMHAFMEKSPAEKRRVVSPWFRTDRWVPRYDLAKRRLTAAQSRLRKVAALQERLREVIADGAESKANLADEIEFEQRTRAVLEVTMSDVATAKAALEVVFDREASAVDARAEVSRLEVELAGERTRVEGVAVARAGTLRSAEFALSGANGRRDEIRRAEAEAGRVDELREAVAAVRDKLSEVRAAGEVAKTTREGLLAKYTTLNEERTGTCPVLGEPCDRVERDEAVIQEIRTAGLRERRAIDRAARVTKEFEWTLDMARADLKTGEEVAARLAALRGMTTPAQAEATHEAAKRAAEDADAELARLKLGKTETGRALRRAQKALKGLEVVESDEETRALADASERRSLAEVELRRAEKDLATARANCAAVDEATAELEGLDAERAAGRAEVEQLAWATYAFGASGIPSRELENAFGVAEVAMNRVLADLGAPTQLRFSPTRELKEWEPACLACGEVFRKGTRKHECHECGVPRQKKRRDELRLEVLDGEYASAFGLDSGGGQVLLSLGARLGLATLPAAVRRVRCESAIVDEPDGALDPPNRTALHRLLTNRLPALGIRQALLITHTDVRHEFDSVVVVKRWADEDRSGAWRE
jgi:DNA repair exonuclease SbcCD ATPase subunit